MARRQERWADVRDGPVMDRLEDYAPEPSAGQQILGVVAGRPGAAPVPQRFGYVPRDPAPCGFAPAAERQWWKGAGDSFDWWGQCRQRFLYEARKSIGSAQNVKVGAVRGVRTASSSVWEALSRRFDIR